MAQRPFKIEIGSLPGLAYIFQTKVVETIRSSVLVSVSGVINSHDEATELGPSSQMAWPIAFKLK